MPELTIVICTHNRATLLTRTLESLLAAKRPPVDVELLIVANHCSDDTHHLLETYASRRYDGLAIRWFAEPTKGKSHALNAAIRAVLANLVAFVDDDQRVDPEFLTATCTTALQVPEADLICGRLLPDWDGSEPSWVHDAGPYRIFPLPVPNFDLGDESVWLNANTAIPSGGNFTVRAPCLRRVGDFSTNLGPVGHDLGGSEDSEWLLRALRSGAKLRYDPSIIQRHHIEAKRLSLGFMLRLTFKRTASTVGLIGATVASDSAAPLWTYRKLASYCGRVVTSLSANRRRFYLMRSAAALGEIAGYRAYRNRTKNATSSQSPASSPRSDGRS